MNFDERLDELFLDLPEPPQAVGSHVNAVRAGKFLYISGVLPRSEGKMMTGRAGVEIRLDTACNAARAAAMVALSIMRSELDGTLNKVKRIAEISVFVASSADFKDHFKVLGAVGELMVKIFGPSGKAVRKASGAASLPENATVELSMIVELK